MASRPPNDARSAAATVHVGAAVADPVHVAARDVRDVLDGTGDPYGQAPHLPGQLIRKVGQVEVPARMKHQHQWNADSFVRAFAAVSVNAHNLCGRLSRAQGLCGNPEGCADGVRSHQAPEFSLVTEDQPCVVVAYANWYFQG